MKKTLLIICIFSIPLLSMGQAIRLNYLCADFYQASAGGSNLFVGLGYEQNVGDKIAVSLEYNLGFGFTDGGENGQDISYIDGSGQSVEFSYYTEMPWNEFSYQSKYFSGNDDNSGYLSMGIAYRKTKVQTNVYGQNLNGYPSYALAPSYVEESLSQLPISLKIGYRGSIDGWFGDYFLGVSYIPGASSQGLGIPIIDNNPVIDNKPFRSVSINFGLAFGFGWAE